MVRMLVDSAADFLTEELNEKKIFMVPLTITVDDKDSYRDEMDLTRDELFRLMIEEGKSVKTSQPSPQSFVEVFEQVKAAGDELVCLMLSSTLSGTYRSAMLAKDIVDYDKIYIVDTLSATIAIKLMVDHALDLIAQGKSGEEIAKVMEEMKGKTRIMAGIDTLKYLYLGGRVSRTTAIVADAVNIKPAIIVDPQGAVAVTGKYLGLNRAVKDLVKQAKAADIDHNFPVYLIYSYTTDNCDKLKKSLDAAGIETNGMYQLGATLGVHVGPGAFGVIYIAK